jgi:hypothetical protein
VLPLLIGQISLLELLAKEYHDSQWTVVNILLFCCQVKNTTQTHLPKGLYPGGFFRSSDFYTKTLSKQHKMNNISTQLSKANYFERPNGRH